MRKERKAVNEARSEGYGGAHVQQLLALLQTFLHFVEVELQHAVGVLLSLVVLETQKTFSCQLW